MTYKLTTPPEGPTNDHHADIAALFRWARELSREREIDKRHIRDAVLQLSDATKTTFTITNHTARTSLDADATDAGELADFLGSLLLTIESVSNLLDAAVS
jgi:hypothetical protein